MRIRKRAPLVAGFGHGGSNEAAPPGDSYHIRAPTAHDPPKLTGHLVFVASFSSTHASRRDLRRFGAVVVPHRVDHGPISHYSIRREDYSIHFSGERLIASGNRA